MGQAPIQDNETFEVWPENWDAVRLFTAVGTQWRHGPMGHPVGLDYSAVTAVMPLYAEPSADLLDQVRVMEHATLKAIEERR